MKSHPDDKALEAAIAATHIGIKTISASRIAPGVMKVEAIITTAADPDEVRKAIEALFEEGLPDYAGGMQPDIEIRCQ